MATNLSNVWKEIGALPTNRGLLMKEQVLAFAKKNRGSATWKWFDERNAWDNSKAAEIYRLRLAGDLIRVVYTEYTPEGTEEPVKVRVLHSLSSDRAHGGGYRKIGSILRNDVKRQTLIADALAALEQVRKRYKHLAALITVWEAMDEIQRQNTFPGDARRAAG